MQPYFRMQGACAGNGANPIKLRSVDGRAKPFNRCQHRAFSQRRSNREPVEQTELNGLIVERVGEEGATPYRPALATRGQI